MACECGKPASYVRGNVELCYEHATELLIQQQSITYSRLRALLEVTLDLTLLTPGMSYPEVTVRCAAREIAGWALYGASPDATPFLAQLTTAAERKVR